MESEIDSLNGQKHVIVDALLPLCPFLLIDGKKAGVELPESLQQAELVLRLGRDPKVMGMPDLVLDGRGFRVTISLRGGLYAIDVPWEAVSRCWVGDPFVGPMVAWPEDETYVEQEEEKPERKGPGLRLVKN
jgi:hypothetical protein